MNENKPKVLTTGMLEIVINGSKILQGHIIGHLVSQTENQIPDDQNRTLTQGSLEYADHRKDRNVNSSPSGQTDLTKSEYCKKQIPSSAYLSVVQVPSFELAEDGCNYTCSPRKSSVHRNPEETSDSMEHEQNEYSNILVGGGDICPVSNPSVFGGPGPIPQDTYIFDVSKLQYPNTGNENIKYVTTPRLAARGNSPKFPEQLNYSPIDPQSDSRTGEISGLFKQEISRLRKMNDEAVAMISARQNLSKQSTISEDGKMISNYCNVQNSIAGRKSLHLYINRLISECDTNVNDCVRKKIIEGVLEFVRSNSDWLKLNFPKDSGDENSKPPSKVVNFQVSGTYNGLLKDKGTPREQDMTITSMQIMSGCEEYKPSTIYKEPSSPHKEGSVESEKSKSEEEE